MEISIVGADGLCLIQGKHRVLWFLQLPQRKGFGHGPTLVTSGLKALVSNLNDACMIGRGSRGLLQQELGSACVGFERRGHGLR